MKNELEDLMKKEMKGIENLSPEQLKDKYGVLLDILEKLSKGSSDKLVELHKNFGKKGKCLEALDKLNAK
jgi:hypothetical protein